MIKIRQSKYMKMNNNTLNIKKKYTLDINKKIYEFIIYENNQYLQFIIHKKDDIVFFYYKNQFELNEILNILNLNINIYDNLEKVIELIHQAYLNHKLYINDDNINNNIIELIIKLPIGFKEYECSIILKKNEFRIDDKFEIILKEILLLKKNKNIVSDLNKIENLLDNLKSSVKQKLNENMMIIKLLELKIENNKDIIEKNKNDINKLKEEIFNIKKKAEKIFLEKEKKNNLNKSFNKTIHNNIKCNNCLINPIIGIRYKCIKCDNYNLCELCEEINEESLNHPHNFIKIKNEQKININNISNNNNNGNKNEYIIALNELYIYSYELLNKKEDVYICNTSKIKIITLILKNNSKLSWPEGHTKLICNRNKSLICFDDIILPPLKTEEYKDIKIELHIPYNLPFQTYKIYMNFNVNGKNYGKEIVINTIIVTELKAFRIEFDLLDDTFSDNDILDALRKKGKWEDAFDYLINLY